MIWTPTGVSHCPWEPQESSGWQGPQDVSGLTSVSKQGQTRLLKVLSSRVLKTSQERLHNLSGQPVPLPGCPDGEIVSPYNQSPPDCFTGACRLSACSMWRSWICFLVTPAQALLGLCEARSSPGWMSRVPPASPHRLLCNLWLVLPVGVCVYKTNLWTPKCSTRCQFVQQSDLCYLDDNLDIIQPLLVKGQMSVCFTWMSVSHQFLSSNFIC